MSTEIKAEWLDRNTNKLPFFTLTGSDDIYRDVCKHLKIEYPEKYIPDNASACVHYYEDEDKKSVCVVSLDIMKWLEKDQADVLALLVHEASHVVDEHFLVMGERKPAPEQRAYALQYVSGELFIEYRRQKEALIARASAKA